MKFSGDIDGQLGVD